MQRHREAADDLFAQIDAAPAHNPNLAADPAHAAMRNAMEAQLRAMLDPDAVDAEAKAAQAALVARFGGPQVAANIGAAGATPAPL